MKHYLILLMLLFLSCFENKDKLSNKFEYQIWVLKNSSDPNRDYTEIFFENKDTVKINSAGFYGYKIKYNMVKDTLILRDDKYYLVWHRDKLIILKDSKGISDTFEIVDNSFFLRQAYIKNVENYEMRKLRMSSDALDIEDEL